MVGDGWGEQGEWGGMSVMLYAVYLSHRCPHMKSGKGGLKLLASVGCGIDYGAVFGLRGQRAIDRSGSYLFY